MSTVFVEAFGKMVPDGGIDAVEEDLYSVFNSRSEMMGFAGGLGRGPASLPLWGMNEAELPEDSNGRLVEHPRGRIGYAQVGAELDVVGLLVPLVQCFYDALSRFGTVDVTAYQVTVGDSELYGQFGITELNWLNLRPSGRVKAVVACSQDLLGSGGTANLAGQLARWEGSFMYGPAGQPSEGNLIVVPEESSFFPPVSPSIDGLCIPVELPEWSASAAAWAIAIVIEAARVRGVEFRSFAVRVTRVS